MGSIPTVGLAVEVSTVPHASLPNWKSRFNSGLPHHTRAKEAKKHHKL